MTSPKWKTVFHDLVESGDTIACEFQPDGSQTYFMAKAGRSVDSRSVKAMLNRELLRPHGIQIDPQIAQAYEPVPQ